MTIPAFVDTQSDMGLKDLKQKWAYFIEKERCQVRFMYEELG
jgi:hypothetical protein